MYVSKIQAYIRERKRYRKMEWVTGKGRGLEAFIGETRLKIDLEQSRMFIAVNDGGRGKEVHINMAGRRCA